MKNFNLDSDILTQIKHLNKCLKQGFDNKLSSYGLTGVQGRVLFCINKCFMEDKQIRQADLEKCLHCSKSTISELISRMTENGLINKIKKKNGFSLIPTERGQSIVNEIFDSRKEVVEILFSGFSEKEINEVTDYLTRMTENIEKEVQLCGKK